jgi:hypothetical protein
MATSMAEPASACGSAPVVLRVRVRTARDRKHGGGNRPARAVGASEASPMRSRHSVVRYNQSTRPSHPACRDGADRFGRLVIPGAAHDL